MTKTVAQLKAEADAFFEEAYKQTLALNALVEQEPWAKNSLGHEWIRDEDGAIDIWAYHPGDPHNGPRCAKCGYGFCHHCHDMPNEPCSEKE